ncbi:cytosolic leucyl tRNA synthetase [Coemansia sp. RSA 2675]|nr:cytosolic leucyl tRNA synthetase [Coemansia sp. RSA 2675]KAJ2415388.1 cytosolic leucyl tRNA synthetase [Coemansia sp. RSA 2530]KAJ2702269.1 cytosolic leucyl tRNA synthetase [Coemansia sp. IMI 209128]
MTLTTITPADSANVEVKKTVKRDELMEIEKHWQADWKESRLFEVDVPESDDLTTDELHAKYPKWMGTIPYPYMNGPLHLGHGFSISKIEFATGWERLKGKRALFPFGFHVTGMPIKASADKIANELAMFGPNFELPQEIEDDCEALSEKVEDMSVDVTPKAGANFKSKKTKAVAKSGGAKYQFQILQAQGISNEEIAKFADTQHWLEYYPPIAMADINALGCKVDWRRAFLTTDHNPYYDSFARWQFQRLLDNKKIKFGKRYTIWSAKDAQPCMDHDRQSGEGVNPQEYTGIKLEILEWSEHGSQTASAIPELAGKRIFLVAATLRPETMYGQTNCFVGTKLEYGFYLSNKADEVFVVSERAARNMAFQELSPENGKVVKLGTISGQAIIGSKVNAPLSEYKGGVYVLPMENVLATKGTGVVTSVPSDSPDDYAALRDLKKKPEYYGIDPKWVEDFNPIAVLSTEAYGEMSAPTLCEKLKINSQKDRVQLAEAKEAAYKEGFYSGTMSIGDFKGLAVQVAKQMVRAQLIESGDAVGYAEPEGLVMSRSGDECVVAKCDQWYIDYGEESWKALTKKCLAQMNTYGDDTRAQFEAKLDWLNEWACVRSFGLGSKVPWDESFVIESLSDSTIYMSYYTISHLLHRSLDGSEIGPLGVTADDMDYSAWDYVLLGKDLPSGHSKAAELAELRRSYLYWYPLDNRSSAKDLVQNHLTFFMYNHTALFPEREWPRSVRINGHLLLNSEKMSKSTGNSLSLREACDRYGADATRLALAVAGDSMEDANFEEPIANAEILRLHTLKEWVTDALEALAASEKTPSEETRINSVALCPASAPYTTLDRVFNAKLDMYTLATGAAYEAMMYREAIINGLYEFLALRDWYRETSAATGMHPTLLRKWISRQVIHLCPVAPHWCEHVWRTLMGNTTSILNARWPTDLPADADHALLSAGEYMMKLVKSVRDAEASLQRRSKKKGSKEAQAGEFNPSEPKTLDIFVASSFPQWQEDVISVLKECFDAATSTFDDKAIQAALGQRGLLKNKKAMPFAQVTKKRISLLGPAAFDRALTFAEIDVLSALLPYMSNNMGYSRVNIVDLGNADELGSALATVAESAVPGEPGILVAKA